MLSPLIKSSQELIVHALEHYTMGNVPLDFKLAILHLDQSVELLLKDKVRLLGKSIYKKDMKTTIGYQEIYQILDDAKYVLPEKVNLEMLHDERNALQHKFASPDKDTVSFHVDNALQFIERFFFEEFKIKLDDFVPNSFLTNERLKFVSLDKKIHLLLKSAATNVLRDPSSSILSAATALEGVLQDKFLELDHTKMSKYWTRKSMLKDLVKANILISEEENEVNLIFNVRNEISHTDYISSSDQAEKILNQIWKIIEKLNK